MNSFVCLKKVIIYVYTYSLIGISKRKKSANGKKPGKSHRTLCANTAAAL